MKKSMLTLLALSALINQNLYSSALVSGQLTSGSYSGMNGTSGPNYSDFMHNNDQNKNNGYFERDHQQLRNDLEQLRSNHMDRMNHFEDMMHNMESKMPAIPVLDSKGNVIGQYKMLGDAKGYHYGSFYTNINQTPVLVIQNGTNQGTPVTVAVPGASSTIIGYLENPKYNAQMNGQAGSGSQMITLYQYTMPAVAKNTVKVQSYSHDNDNNDKHHKHHKHHHDEDDNDDNHRHHLITLF